MELERNRAGKQLSSGMTTFLKDVFPILWTMGVGAGMVGIWLELFGEPATLGLKVLGGAIWAGTSILLTAWSRRVHHVWLDGSDLIVSSEGRDVRIRLADVTGMSETRGQRVKTIKLTLRPGSPLGSSIRFIPKNRLQAPFSEHPIITELKENKRSLAGANRPGELDNRGRKPTG